MRLTINLREDLYAVAVSLARAEGVSVSEAVNRLVAKALVEPKGPVRKSKSGLPIVRGARSFGPDDVARIESES